MAGPPRDVFLHCTQYLRKTIRFDTINAGATNGIEFDFQVPAGGFIRSITIHKVTAFNAGTTNDLTIGTTGNPTGYVATGVALGGTAGVVTAVGPGRVTTDTTVVVKYAQSGTAATAGEADVVVEFVPR